MSPEQARHILEAAHPRGADSSDPQVLEALRVVEADPALNQWWTRQQREDQALAAKLGEIQPPADLLGAILAQKKIVPVPAFRRRAFLAWAACAALGAGGATLAVWKYRKPDPRSFRAFRQEMIDNVTGLYWLDLQTDDRDQVRQWLQANAGLAEIPSPGNLGQYPLRGCRSIPWQGGRVVLICYRVDGDIIHLFQVPASALADPPQGTQPGKLRSAGEWNTSAWQDKEKKVIYLAMTLGSSQYLRRSLTGAG